jgi:MFS transporter, UMF1 family
VTVAGVAPRAAGAFTLPAISWALYDFANTMFSYVVVTRYFNDWIIEQRRTEDVWVGVMTFMVAAVLVVTLPVAGAVADRWGRRKPLLVAFTLLCVAATAVLGFVPTTPLALVVAGIAIFGFNSALAHYDPLLAHVAAPEHRGRVSGFGVGLGYVGVFFVLALFAVANVVPEGENQRAFLPTAVLFLLFALPAFFIIREPRVRRATPEGARLVRDALAQVVGSLGEIRNLGVGRFLLARFLYVDAIATVIAFMIVYAKRVSDLSEGTLTVLLGVSIAFAVVGAFAAGVLVERLGPKRVLFAILLLFAATLVVTGATGSELLLWVAGPITGLSLGAVWTSDRVFMLRLTPEDKRGEFFGLYALAGKLSSGVGPLVLWGGTIWLLSTVLDVLEKPGASRVALLVLALAALAGVLVLRPLSDRTDVGTRALESDTVAP